MPHPNHWSADAVQELFNEGVLALLWRAQTVHRRYHDSAAIELASLLSIKTGGCPEDCAYCPQSKHHDAGLPSEPMLDLPTVRQAARKAKAQGAKRFCMGAAWRSPTEKQIDQVIPLIKEIKALGLESCVTLGMLKKGQAERLRAAGLDYYNHNLDTSVSFYDEIISTRQFADRLDTLRSVRAAGLKSCVGGIIGLGESVAQRAELIATLANLDPYPESVPINQLVAIPGTPLGEQPPVPFFEFLRTIAIARICMPKAKIRLSAGREQLSDSEQTLCFLAGANSIFVGELLLTTPNTSAERDRQLLKTLGLTAEVN